MPARSLSSVYVTTPGLHLLPNPQPGPLFIHPFVNALQNVSVWYKLGIIGDQDSKKLRKGEKRKSTRKFKNSARLGGVEMTPGQPFPENRVCITPQIHGGHMATW